uniref:TauD/TfdA-like domain-containing protein n=1 Tax=Chromera velia CCMP2878 TaxID=1169474 RepID=A0A0G4GXI3_9ALVE|mmetsp:Transcript_18111/g.36735  ORF Transcript_18111/g.36735 Transcript_18111/m.36735 type:complete len:314 (+) Transcript_18111:137-1078(+)|eukprot:Cvel_778.t1-p1 / transcript=Cvel_778.t1 / gene=Cvel_778 / organism=Chromera_velia_CCMP2878 / gene_product=hypothetical protein / transcript_product=hypothetical protein / location=Cvel_scaffold24:67390-71595(+) / protein_length=313 / sequence_SO=supercontig / SO=protein_coding / is_pseudo=false
MKMASTGIERAYSLTRLTSHFGAEVRDLQLREDLPQKTVDALVEDTHRYGMLLFRGQGRLSAEVQLAVSRWFGEVQSTFSKHPKSPHPDIFRVSNDRREGCTNVGRSGWHIDGTFLSAPFKIQTMHFWSVCEGGNTRFTPLAPLLEKVPSQVRKEWSHLLYLSDRGPAHPFVYAHPVTGLPTLCFHCGLPFTAGFARVKEREGGGGNGPARDEKTGEDPDELIQGPRASLISQVKSKQLLEELAELLEDQSLCYELSWQAGDFAILDNLAAAHFAVPNTQADPDIAGLRILHRTTVRGDVRPLWDPTTILPVN